MARVAPTRSPGPPPSRTQSFTSGCHLEMLLKSRNTAQSLSGRAFRDKPSWFLIAENDRMVAPATQRFLAERMRSKVVSVTSDHVPLASRADAVVDVVEEAAKVAALDA